MYSHPKNTCNKVNLSPGILVSPCQKKKFASYLKWSTVTVSKNPLALQTLKFTPRLRRCFVTLFMVFPAIILPRFFFFCFLPEQTQACSILANILVDMLNCKHHNIMSAIHTSHEIKDRLHWLAGLNSSVNVVLTWDRKEQMQAMFRYCVIPLGCFHFFSLADIQSLKWENCNSGLPLEDLEEDLNSHHQANHFKTWNPPV